MPKYMIIGIRGPLDLEGVLEVVKAEDVDVAREYIRGRYPVADDLFEPIDQLPESKVVLSNAVPPFPAPAGLDWVDEGELIHKILLIRFSTDEQAEIHDLDAPQNNNAMGQAGGRRRSRKQRSRTRRTRRTLRRR
jgi:hypothetical protein